MLNTQRQRGMTLVEVMIAMGVGLFLLLGLTTFLTANLASNAGNLQQNLLNSELRAVMTLMARDIRRAGYWGGASFTTGSLSGIGFGPGYVNPFATINTATAGCILYSYDRNSNQTLEIAEQYGFLHSNNAILMRTGVGATAFNCTTAVENAWDTLTDTKITQITSLTFTPKVSAPVYLSGTSGPNMKTRLVTISITGRSLADASITQTLTETVKLANDLYSPS